MKQKRNDDNAKRKERKPSEENIGIPELKKKEPRKKTAPPTPTASDEDLAKSEPRKPKKDEGSKRRKGRRERRTHTQTTQETEDMSAEPSVDKQGTRGSKSAEQVNEKRDSKEKKSTETTSGEKTEEKPSAENVRDKMTTEDHEGSEKIVKPRTPKVDTPKTEVKTSKDDKDKRSKPQKVARPSELTKRKGDKIIKIDEQKPRSKERKDVHLNKLLGRITNVIETSTARKKRVKETRKAPRNPVVKMTGVTLQTDKFSWSVVKPLHSGKTIDLFAVQKIGNSDDKIYCMKKEMMSDDRLKTECALFHQLFGPKGPQKGDSRADHLAQLIDRGSAQDFKFIIVTMLGPNLADVRSSLPGKKFSKESALNIAIQTLSGLSVLHAAGYVHGDIQVRNFAIGHDTEEKIYLLDFGIARRYADQKTGKPLPIRKNLKLVGNLRNASRSALNGNDLLPRDDLESWIYMVFELLSRNCLPWKGVVNKKNVLRAKELFFNHEFPECYEMVPAGMKDIVEHINKMKPEDKSQASSISSMIMSIGMKNSIEWTKQPEWIGKIRDEPSRDSKESSLTERDLFSEETSAKEKKKK